ncbi:hypothetical protein FB451DRAFT_1260710 [Mycena latifolia]|nr:hypothetical protein FB451DRAFT_1260710 [Mycena latifolia]
MPSKSAITQIRLGNIITCLNAAVTTVEVVSKGLQTPFLEPIINTVCSLLTAAQTIKKNKDECVEMLEQIHQLLYALIQVHITSNTGGELPPKMLSHLGCFTETLHKIHTFVEAQQGKMGIKLVFRQGEMTTLLKSCTLGLEQALDIFMVNRLDMVTDMAAMDQSAQRVHQEVLELITSLSDDKSSDRSLLGSACSNSSNSFSLLPPEPKIFHGRDSELSAILRAFDQEVPRIAILGAGGMGKTSLSRAVLHHTELISRYQQHRLFIPCDTVSTSIQLAGLIGAHIGLKQGNDLTRPVIHHFLTGSPAVVILDNLETLWEPVESRADVEKFMGLLTDVKHLALIITMRGAERPASVRWTHPFLEPLKPLGLDAARQTFIDIVDDIYETKDIDKILLLADNMPLAIDLIAHLVDSEGIPSVLSRWETRRTSILSDGHDATSNLELSISLSLSGPRMVSSPHALDLLSLLSMLPDGLSDVELLQSRFPLKNILAYKSTLLSTALAYSSGQKRLKVLVPVREYVQKNHPPSTTLIHPLSKYYQELLELYDQYGGTLSNVGVMPRVASNFANIQNILLHCLHLDSPNLAEIITSTCQLIRYGRLTGHGTLRLLDYIPKSLPQPTDHKLEAYFIIQKLRVWRHRIVPDANQLICQALEHFKHFHDPEMQCDFYNVAATYHNASSQDHAAALQFCQSHLSLGISIGSLKSQSLAFNELAVIQMNSGDFSGAQENAAKSQRAAQIAGNLYVEAAALRVEAMCWQYFGSYSYCLSLLDRAIHLLDLCGMSAGELHSGIRNSQAEVHRCKSEYAEAHNIQIHILKDWPADQNPIQHAFALLNIAQVDVELGSTVDDVQWKINTAGMHFQKINYALGIVYCDVVRAALDVRQDNFPAAKKLFKKCLKSPGGNTPEAFTYCVEKLASVQQWSAADHNSSTWPVILLVYSVKSKQRLELHKGVQFLGDLFHAQGDKDTATSLFTVALDGFTKMDVHRSRAECMVRLGDISVLKGDELKAATLWETARPLFERSSQSKQVAQVDVKLAGLVRAIGKSGFGNGSRN